MMHGDCLHSQGYGAAHLLRWWLVLLSLLAARCVWCGVPGIAAYCYVLPEIYIYAQFAVKRREPGLRLGKFQQVLQLPLGQTYTQVS